MLKVNIYYMDKGEEAVGSIYWDGEGFKTESGSKGLFDHILSRPVYVPDGGEVFSHEDPERWITNLFLHYKSPYLRATKAERVDVEKAVKFVPAHTSKTKHGKAVWVMSYHAQKKEVEPHKASNVSAEALLGEFWDAESDEAKIELQRAYDTDAQIWEGQTIGQHTEMVLDRFDRYFLHSRSLEGYFQGLKESEKDARRIFRFFLALHDIGKAIAIQTTGDKNKQHEYAAQVVAQHMRTVQGDDSKVQVFSDMAAQDIIGNYLSNPKVGPIISAQKIVDLAAKNNMPAPDMLSLLKVYYMCDAGSYTKDAGNYESLDHLFKFHTKGKEVDEYGHNRIYDRDTMEFSPSAKIKMDVLKEEVIKIDQSVGEYSLAFHGTSGEYLKDIIERGLENKKYHNFDPDLYKGTRSKSVFVTTSVADASWFAEIAAARKTNPPVILKLKIPKEVFRHSKPDYDWNPTSAFMLPEVRPEWIEAVADGHKLDLPFLTPTGEVSDPELMVGTTAQQNEKMFAKLFQTIWERINKAMEDFVIVYLPESMSNWLKLKEKLGEASN